MTAHGASASMSPPQLAHSPPVTPRRLPGTAPKSPGKSDASTVLSVLSSPKGVAGSSPLYPPQRTAPATPDSSRRITGSGMSPALASGVSVRDYMGDTRNISTLVKWLRHSEEGMVIRKTTSPASGKVHSLRESILRDPVTFHNVLTACEREVKDIPSKLKSLYDAQIRNEEEVRHVSAENTALKQTVLALERERDIAVQKQDELLNRVKYEENKREYDDNLRKQAKAIENRLREANSEMESLRQSESSLKESLAEMRISRDLDRKASEIAKSVAERNQSIEAQLDGDDHPTNHAINAMRAVMRRFVPSNHFAEEELADGIQNQYELLSDTITAFNDRVTELESERSTLEQTLHESQGTLAAALKLNDALSEEVETLKKQATDEKVAIGVAPSNENEMKATPAKELASEDSRDIVGAESRANGSEENDSQAGSPKEDLAKWKARVRRKIRTTYEAELSRLQDLATSLGNDLLKERNEHVHSIQQFGEKIKELEQKNQEHLPESDDAAELFQKLQSANSEIAVLTKELARFKQEHAQLIELISQSWSQGYMRPM